MYPGQSKTYTLANKQLPATLWYHDHARHYTSINVYMGLSDFYILTDSYEDSLNLSAGQYDIPLAIQDRSFNADGSFNYTDNVNGELGDTQLVNGAVQPHLDVGTRKYRFRILNGSNARKYVLALDNDQNFIQIGTDGGLLGAAVIRNTIPIATAERADVVIDFSNVPVGVSIVLQNQLESGGLNTIISFNVTQMVSDNSDVPDVLRPIRIY